MDDARRRLLIGLGPTLMLGIAGYLGYVGYRRSISQQPLQPEPEPQRPPPVELARIHAELGTSLSPDAVYEPLAFDRRASFGEIREVLRALGPVEIELVVEVHTNHRAPYLAGLPVLLDVGPEPGMVAQDAEARAAQASIDAMPTPWTYTGIHVGRDHVLIDHGGEFEALTAPSLESEGPWSSWEGSMWTLAQRSSASRLNDRWPWIFAADDAPWALVVRVIEATTPPECQPHRERGGCNTHWANLFVGPPTT